MLNALAYLPTHLLEVIIVLVWGMFILVALPAAITALYGLYRIEYFLLPWFGGGMVLACIGTWLSTIFKDHSLGPRALMVTALVFLIALRYSSLQELVRLNRENHVGDEDE